MLYTTEAHGHGSNSGVERFLITFNRLAASCTTAPAENNAGDGSNKLSLPESLIFLKHTQPMDDIIDMNSSQVVVGLKTLQSYVRTLLEKIEGCNDWPYAAQRLAAVSTVFQAGDLRPVAADRNVVFLNATCTAKHNDLSITYREYSQSGRHHGEHCYVRKRINLPYRAIC